MMDENDVNHAHEMVGGEHDAAERYVYRVLIPDGYKVYPDPTTLDGVFITNNIPPKFITKVEEDY